MTEKRFELRLCPNGAYYLWEDNELKSDVVFDKFNKESANELVDLLNELADENEQLKQKINELQTDKAFGQQEYQRRLND